MSQHKGERVRLTLRLPASDLEHLDAIANAAGLDVNELICRFIGYMLQRSDPTLYEHEKAARR